MKHRVIGIDLGTTRSSVAFYDFDSDTSSCPPPISFATASTKGIYSMVSLDRRGRIIVGEPASHDGSIKDSGRNDAVANVKALMGQEVGGVPTTIRLGKREFMPQEITALILMKLKQTAELEIGHDVHDAVIAVPSTYNERQRRAVEEAARFAGLHPRQLIPEPAAVTFCYAHDQCIPDSACYLVFDFGGGALNVAVVVLRHAEIRIVATAEDSGLGGNDIDDLLVSWAINSLRTNYGTDIADTPSNRALIKDRANRLKHQLSVFNSGHLSLVEFTPNDPLELELSRTEFEQMIEPLMTRSLDCVERAMGAAADAGIYREEVQAILAVGGSTRIPMVRRKLQDHFGEGEGFIKTDLDPETSVARGASLAARSFEASPASFDLTEENGGGRNIESHQKLQLTSSVSSHGIGIGLGGRFLPILERGCSIPAAVTMKFTNEGPSRFLEIPIYQGESATLAENCVIGRLQLGPMEERPMGQHQFELTLAMDSNGALSISANHVNEARGYAANMNTIGGVAEFEAKRRMLEKVFAGTAVSSTYAPPAPAPPPINSVTPEGPPSDPRPNPALTLPRVLGIAAVPVPVQYQSIVRRATKSLSRSLDAKLLQSFNEFITALNSGQPENVLEDFADRLEDAYLDVRDAPAAVPAPSRSLGKVESYRFSAFYPEKVRPQDNGMIIAFAHWEFVAGEVVREAARRLDLPVNVSMKVGTETSKIALPRECVIRVSIDVPGLVFPTADAKLPLWEAKQSVEFRFRPDPCSVGQLCKGWLHFWLDNMILAEVPVSILVASDDVPEIFRDALAQATAKPYRSVFPSYSHLDAAIVEQLEVYAASFGDEYLRDVRKLRAGQAWKDELLEFIKRADVFQLFWSENASQSDYVREEWLTALKEREFRRDQYFLRPVYWAPRPTPPPPSELVNLHFARLPLGK